jgi:hypothetical protein
MVNSVFDINSTFYKNTTYSFTDLNGKLSYKLSEKQIITLTTYFGKDNFSLIKLEPEYKNAMKWGNQLLSANWYYQINSDWNLQSTLGYTKYDFNLAAEQKNVTISMFSGVNDYVFRTEASKAGYNGQIIKFGVENYFHSFMPNNLDSTSN